MSLQDQTIPKSVLDAAESMRGFNLIVPEGVERNAKGFATFDELVTVESARHTESGDVTIFELKVKVMPGLDPEMESPNVGKSPMYFLRYNFPALRAGSPQGQVTMSQITAVTLKQFAVAVALDISNGLNGPEMAAMFPAKGSDDASLLEGERFLLTITDDARPEKQHKGSTSKQSISAVVAAPEEV